MSPFVYLALAIVAELFGSSMLKLSDGFKRFWPSVGVLVGIGSALYLLSLALLDLPLGTVYATWAGVGTAATAVIGVVAFKEKATAKKFAGIAMIIVGVVILKLATNGH